MAPHRGGFQSRGESDAVRRWPSHRHRLPPSGLAIKALTARKQSASERVIRPGTRFVFKGSSTMFFLRLRLQRAWCPDRRRRSLSILPRPAQPDVCKRRHGVQFRCWRENNNSLPESVCRLLLRRRWWHRHLCRARSPRGRGWAMSGCLRNRSIAFPCR